MKIIRWFFSHILLIMMVIVVIYSYMYWGNLLGKDTPAGKALAYLSNEFEYVDKFVTDSMMAPDNAETEQQAAEPAISDSTDSGTVAAPAADTVSDVTDEAQSDAETEQLAAEASATDQSSAEVSESEAGDEAAASAGKAAVVGAMQPVISYKHNKQLVTQNMAEAPAMDAAPVAEPQAEQVAKSATASGPDNYVSAEIEEQLNNVDESGQIIDPSRSGEAVRASWVEARKAFYRRDYQQSELHYKKVIDNTEDNFDAYGELGNVYFNQGKNEQAAAAYFQAALILIDKGQDRRARSLLGLLGRLDAGKAEELKALLETKDAQ